MRHRSSYIVVTLLAVVTLLFSCVEIPTDPATDASNASIRFILEDDATSPVVDYGAAIKIGLKIHLTNLLDTVRVTSGCGIFDTMFTVDSAKVYDTVWFSARFEDEGECVFTAEATMRDGSLKNKSHTLSIHVLAEKPGINFVKTPSACTITADETDTLVFVTAVKGGTGIPVYTLKVTPEEGCDNFTSKYSEMRDTVRVIVSPETIGEYEVVLSAVSSNGDDHLTDTAAVIVTVKAGIALSFVHAPETLIAGKADTLLFAVDNSTRSDLLTIALSADPPLDSSIFTLVPTGADSLMIAISETAQACSTTIGVVTGNGGESDTAWYPIVISPDTVKTEPEESPVSITRQPSISDTVFSGDTISLSVVAEGTPAPEYQWYRNDAPLTGDTAATFTIEGVSAADSGTYTVVVSNGVGEAKTSEKVLLHILTEAAFTKNPESTPVGEGGQVTFSVTAVGDEPLSYQWQVNRQDIEGEIGTSYTINSAVPADDGKKYRCIVTNAFSSDTSLEAVLSVTDKPVYTVKFDTDGGSSVDSQRVKEGDNAGRPLTEPTKSEYEFSGWYLSNVSDTEFDFSTAIIGGVTIYAKWTPVYRVTYHANGGTGSVTDTTRYKSGDRPTVKSGSGLSRPGYTFEKWTSEKDGSGSSYESGNTFQIGSSSVKLWAQWKRNLCMVTFDGSGATTLPSPASKTIDEGTAIGSFPTEPKKTAYVFFGWWTGVGGTGDSVTAGKTFSSSKTLYAKWVIMDVDRNIYTEVKIGNQVWMVENLKTTRYNTDVTIPMIKDSLEWFDASTAAFCWLNNDSLNKKLFGALYNWYAVNSGILAPSGWRVPTKADWEVLITSAGGEEVAGSHLKDTILWDMPEVGKEDNQTGFSALPGGGRYPHGRTIPNGGFMVDNLFGLWWTSNAYDDSTAYSCTMAYYNTAAQFSCSMKTHGYSVRCIREY